MTRTIALLLGSLLLIPAAGAGARRAPSRAARPARASLLESGEFHGDEVRARNGERWLGLFATGRQSSLAPVTLSVARVRDEIVDEGSGARTSKRVRARGKAQPLFMVRGRGLRQGPVTTVYRGRREDELRNGSRISLNLPGHRYELQVMSAKGKPGEGVSPDARLLLAEGQRTQALYSLRSAHDWGHGEDEPGEWRLVWAGDLDHDGRLDLCVELSSDYNSSELALFLSSAARPGRLVRQVGSLATVGC